MTAAASSSESAFEILKAHQHGVFTRLQALAAGWSKAQIDTLVRTGAWLSCGYGGLAVAADSDPNFDHARRCRARLLRTSGDLVVSHESAAVLFGMPYVDPPAKPTLTRPRDGMPVHLNGLHTAA